MYVGVDLMRTGALRREERRLYEANLEELSVSFDDKLEPLVVSVRDDEQRITGTAEVQYEQLRRVLRTMYFDETGFTPEDFSIYIEEEEAPALVPGVDILPVLETPVEAATEPAAETRAASDASARFHGGA
jgi:hypothetical protein